MSTFRSRLAVFGTLTTVAAMACTQVAVAASPEPDFEPAVFYDPGSWPSSVAVGDVTGDGLPDALLTTSFYFDDQADFRLWVYPQLPDGRLSHEPSTHLTTETRNGARMAVAPGDFNGDGYVDAAVSTSAGVDIFRQRQGELVRIRTLPTPWATEVEAADVNRDGFADLVVKSNFGIFVWWQVDGRLLRSPVEKQITDQATLELEVGHVNGDRRVDVISGYSGTVKVFLQNRDHSFGRGTALPALPTGRAANGLAVGDVNGDGRNDVVASSGGNQPSAAVAVYSQRNDGTLGAPVMHESLDIPEPVEADDVNGDGRDDVVTVHGGWYNAGVYAQDDTGLLGPEKLFSLPYASHYETKGLALGDVSGDGLNDVLIGDYLHGLGVMRAVGTPPPLNTTITGGPMGRVRSTTTTFAFAANRGGAAFECSLDGRAYTACTSPTTYDGLAPGSDHRLKVRAVADQVIDPTPAVRSFTVAKAADLRVSLRSSKSTVSRGERFRYVVRTVNRGPHTAVRSKVVVRLPDGLALRAVREGRCRLLKDPRRLVCATGDMAADQASRVVLVVAPTIARGRLTVTATASSTTWDPQPDNDNISLVTRVAR